MKRFLVILLFIPTLALGAYTEFYCQSGGSNLNAGSTTNNTALYTATNGGWNSGTKIYTPTNGTNPVSAGVAVGMWASVYIDGATVGVYIGRISAVVNATNGTITVDQSPIGAAPATLASARTIKVGGAWLGPNAASGFPYTLTNFGNNQDSSSDWTRINLKNDQTYTMTAAFTPSSSGNSYVSQGYTSSVGDGGKATWAGGTSTGNILLTLGVSGSLWIDHIFTTTFASGSTDLVTTGSQTFGIYRCVFTGARGSGLFVNSNSGVVVSECESYGNNTSNTTTKAGFQCSSLVMLNRCISHDNTGSNTAGFLLSGTGFSLNNCISETNGGVGISITGSSTGAPIAIANSDVYNNGSDGIKIASSANVSVWIENCNLIKNTGAGINNTSTTIPGFVYNCGYGAGTQANGSADTTNNLTVAGAITYGSNLTPWTDAANGDFSINLAAAQGAGRGVFTETAASYAGTVGYPDIGAAQATPGCTFPTPTATPTATATATATSTNTPTPTPSATFTPTITPCAPTPTATATWTPTPTFTPTSTPTNTPTPTPSATSTPTATACAGGEVSYNHSD